MAADAELREPSAAQEASETRPPARDLGDDAALCHGASAVPSRVARRMVGQGIRTRAPNEAVLPGLRRAVKGPRGHSPGVLRPESRILVPGSHRLVALLHWRLRSRTNRPGAGLPVMRPRAWRHFSTELGGRPPRSGLPRLEESASTRSDFQHRAIWRVSMTSLWRESSAYSHRSQRRHHLALGPRRSAPVE